ncbi:MAG: ABC transporter ATP-binding protein [Bacteroidota bacterium]
MAQVRLENISKVFEKNIVAIKDVNFTVENKEFVVLVGPSGCGKSTTLRMIAGLEEISTGNIFIDNLLVNDVPPKDRDIAMVFQNYALYPHMTVAENLAFSLRMRKYSRDTIERMTLETSKILEIDHLLDRKPKALSGGQRQRVALGRAIIRKPKVFLFDEPLSNLDANLRAQMRTEISRLHKQLEATMIYVTHDQIEAMSMGDRIVVMKDGLVQQVNTPLTIYNKPGNKFVAGFIGSPTMNFFKGSLKKNDDVRFTHESNQLCLPVDMKSNKSLSSFVNSEIIMGIRPEHITARAASPASMRVTVRIEVTEPIGNEIFVYFKLEQWNDQYVCRIVSDVLPETGKLFDLYIDTTKLHFFDITTGQTL